MKNADKMAYQQALAHRQSYMQAKQKRLLPASPSDKVSDEALLRGIDEAHAKIKENGNELTDYKRFRLAKPDVGQAARQKSAAKAAAKEHSQHSSFSDLPRAEKEKFQQGAALIGLSYKGAGVAPSNHQLPEGHALLNSQDLPSHLDMFYDDQTGLIHTPGEAKALLIKNDETIKVVFAGTEMGSKASSGRGDTLATDVGQRLGNFSAMYRDAAGIGRMILDHAPDKKVVFMGHSLGGGLAQFALAANVEQNPERISAMTFNTAGLAASTLGALGKEKVERAHDLVQNMRIEGDPVSPGSGFGEKVKGIALGKMFTLERTGTSGISPSAHGSRTIVDELDKALS